MIKASMSTKKEKYTDFAEHYDYVLKDIDYEEWFHYLKELMLIYNPQAESVLEIGCGTGKFGAKFSSEGYNIIGVDYSLEMLLSAKKRAKKISSSYAQMLLSFHLRKNSTSFSVCMIH